MREYALVRQKPGYSDLLALNMLQITDFSGTAIEIIPIEWIEGYFISGSGESAVNNPTANANTKYGIYENIDYNIIIMPISDNPTSSNMISGCRASDTTGALTRYFGNYWSVASGYVAIAGTKNMWYYLSMNKDDDRPVIGIKYPSGYSPKMVNPNPDDDMRSEKPEPDEPKTEPEPNPEPETKSTRKK